MTTLSAETRTPALQSKRRVFAALGLCTLLGTLLFAYFTPLIAAHFEPCYTSTCDLRHYLETYYFIGPCAIGLLFAIWFLMPYLEDLKRQIDKRWRTAYTAIAIVGACTALSAFIFHYGNRQFGAWDFGLLVDTGWRQFLGQHPYSDFVTTFPPGFNIPVKWAFCVFGPSWNSQLYALIGVSIISFLWIYHLIFRLTDSKLAAFFLSFSIQCASILTLDFLWFNNLTTVTATIFFLSCLAYAKYPLKYEIQISYVLSLAVLSLMKPNTAG